jgi:hypothetical protein
MKIYEITKIPSVLFGHILQYYALSDVQFLRIRVYITANKWENNIDIKYTEHKKLGTVKFKRINSNKKKKKKKMKNKMYNIMINV